MLTLDALLKPMPSLQSGHPARRICLMRHAFRGHKEQLAKVEKWTGVRLSLDEAYPVESRDTIGTPSARQVLNAVRLDRRLTRLASADQGKPGFLGQGDLVLAFAATGGKDAEFLAAFEVRGTLSVADSHETYRDLLLPPPESARKAGLADCWLARGAGYNLLPRPSIQLFDLVDREDILEGYERRLLVEWKSGVSWFQYDLAKEVLALRPRGFVREFSSLLDFTLDFRELRAIVGLGLEGSGTIHGDPVWRKELASASGVYVIQSHEGPLYVGAAYGSEGFLGRWSQYARTNLVATGPGDKVGLRDNTGLKRFLDADGDQALQHSRLDGLRFSIAHVMGKASRREEVLDMERAFKDKLGTRARALDLNDN